MEWTVQALVSKDVNGEKKRVLELCGEGADVYVSHFLDRNNRVDGAMLIQVTSYDGYVSGDGEYYTVITENPDNSVGKLLIRAKSEDDIRDNFLDMAMDFIPSDDTVLIDVVQLDDIDLVQYVSCSLSANEQLIVETLNN